MFRIFWDCNLGETCNRNPSFDIRHLHSSILSGRDNRASTSDFLGNRSCKNIIAEFITHEYAKLYKYVEQYMTIWYTLKLTACVWLNNGAKCLKDKPFLEGPHLAVCPTRTGRLNHHLGAAIWVHPSFSCRPLCRRSWRWLKSDFFIWVWFLCDLDPKILYIIQNEIQVIQLFSNIKFPFLNVSCFFCWDLVS